MSRRWCKISLILADNYRRCPAAGSWGHTPKAGNSFLLTVFSADSSGQCVWEYWKEEHCYCPWGPRSRLVPSLSVWAQSPGQAPDTALPLWELQSSAQFSSPSPGDAAVAQATPPPSRLALFKNLCLCLAPNLSSAQQVIICLTVSCPCLLSTQAHCLLTSLLL